MWPVPSLLRFHLCRRSVIGADKFEKEKLFLPTTHLFHRSGIVFVITVQSTSPFFRSHRHSEHSKTIFSWAASFHLGTCDRAGCVYKHSSTYHTLPRSPPQDGDYSDPMMTLHTTTNIVKLHSHTYRADKHGDAMVSSSLV